jgi:hypothetical protein
MTRVSITLALLLSACAIEPEIGNLQQAVTCAGPVRVQKAWKAAACGSQVKLPVGATAGDALVAVVRKFGGGSAPSGITVSGRAMTSRVTAGSDSKLWIYTLVAVAGDTTANLKCGSDTNVEMVLAEYSGVSVVPESTKTVTNVMGHSLALAAVSSASGGLIVAASTGATWDGLATPAAGWSVLQQWNPTSPFNAIDRAVTAGAYIAQWTLSSDSYAMAAVAAALPGTCVPPPPDMARTPDFARLPDLTLLPDMTILPDLTLFPDLAVSPDLAESVPVDMTVPVADLTPDFSVLPDFSAAPDLATPADFSSPPVPQLGAHMVFARDEQCGTNPALSNTNGGCGVGPFGVLNTQSGSLVLTMAMGWTANHGTPSDSRGNVYSAQGAAHPYQCGGCGTDYETALYKSAGIVGGASHYWSYPLPGRTFGEISAPIVEVRNASHVQDLKYAYANPGGGSPWTLSAGGSVTTTGPALLIAIWGGGGFGLDHDAVPDSGFQVIDSYLHLGPNSAVQVAVAAKQVGAAGAYSMAWHSTTDDNAACYLIAVQ